MCVIDIVACATGKNIRNEIAKYVQPVPDNRYCGSVKKAADQMFTGGRLRKMQKLPEHIVALRACGHAADLHTCSHDEMIVLVRH